MILGYQHWWLMSWQSSAVSFLHGKSSLVMIVLMLLTKILKLNKRPTKLKESDIKRVVMNSRGMKLFTCRWLPANGEPKALVFLCHGYGMESSISMKGRKGTGARLAKAGYGVYGMDYEGHGRSSGLPGYIPSFEDVVTDCSDHYTRISERKKNLKKSRFLMGESMGGTVAILLHLKKPNFWDGAVLIAPMRKVSCLPG
ncbi:caffeoylshikimate esterase-like [Rhododendron vialii]|uniref:caffeoylshikimate esterase-like n=1 Tax=Rhododendron vialii TaxID=182163 RepID=UPI00265FD555|nr:caffeoylshikimate esterase-like [Rhododendron vialii]